MKLLFSDLSRNSQRALILKRREIQGLSSICIQAFCLGPFSNFSEKGKAQRES